MHKLLLISSHTLTCVTTLAGAVVGGNWKAENMEYWWCIYTRTESRC